MNRRQFLTRAALAAPAFYLAAPAWAAPREGFTLLRRNVGYFTGRGGAIGWLASPEALVVVDSQFPDTAEVCWAGLQERTTRRLDFLVNTHHHGDHTGGNGVFKPHARHIVGHREAPRLMAAAAARQAASGGQSAAVPPPDMTYDTRWKADLGDETLRLQYYGPAHTGGDSVVVFEQADVVHMGDLVFNRRAPFIDLAGGASTENWVRVLEAVHADFTDETLFLFGHGSEAYGVQGRRADLLVMRDFLTAVRAYVAAGLRAGKTAEALAVDALPGFPEHTGSGGLSLPNVIRTVYTELSEDR